MYIMGHLPATYKMSPSEIRPLSLRIPWRLHNHLVHLIHSVAFPVGERDNAALLIISRWFKTKSPIQKPGYLIQETREQISMQNVCIYPKQNNKSWLSGYAIKAFQALNTATAKLEL